MKKFLAVAACAASLFCGAEAFAGDTTELLDNGQLEVVPSFGVGGIGDTAAVAAGIDLGYGVTDYMTVTASLGWGADEALANAGAEMGIDVLFTPIDTDALDLDLHFGVATDFGGLTVTPGLELNFDSSNEMDGFGAYLRLDLPIYSERDFVKDEVNTDFGIDLQIGLYYYVAENHQLVLEGGFSGVNIAEKIGDRDVADAFVSLGWNYAVSDNFELTTEVAVEIPTDDDGSTSAALSIGGIFDFNPIK